MTDHPIGPPKPSPLRRGIQELYDAYVRAGADPLVSIQGCLLDCLYEVANALEAGGPPFIDAVKAALLVAGLDGPLAVMGPAGPVKADALLDLVLAWAEHSDPSIREKARAVLGIKPTPPCLHPRDQLYADQEYGNVFCRLCQDRVG